jgi:hypothetical protein
VNGTEFAPKDLPRPAGGRTRFLHRARPPRPSEPILIPKLRIQFADFPYLHYSIDQRLLTLETCCGYGYELVRVRRNLPGIFKVPPSSSWMPRELRHSSPMPKPILPARGFQGLGGLCRKDNSSRAPAGVSWSCRVATTDTRIRTVPLPGSGIWTRFPFGCVRAFHKRSMNLPDD